VTPANSLSPLKWERVGVAFSFSLLPAQTASPARFVQAQSAHRLAPRPDPLPV